MKELPYPTRDNIEMRLCADSWRTDSWRTDEGITIELYVLAVTVVVLRRLKPIKISVHVVLRTQLVLC